MPELQQAAEVAPARSAEGPIALAGRGAGAHRARVSGGLGRAAVNVALILQSLLVQCQRSRPGPSLLSCQDLQVQRACDAAREHTCAAAREHTDITVTEGKECKNESARGTLLCTDKDDAEVSLSKLEAVRGSVQGPDTSCYSKCKASCAASY